MACALTSGRTEPCRDAVGGNKTLFLFDFQEDAFTIAAGEVTAIDAGVSEVFKYELNSDNNTFNETATSDRQTGVTTYEKVFTGQLKKQDKDTQAELNIVMKARTIAVVKDNMGNYKAFGYEDGLIGGGGNQSGGAKSDFNGYDLTLTAIEADYSPFLDAATITALEALVSETNINP